MASSDQGPAAADHSAQAAAHWLRSAAAVRQRAAAMLALAEADGLAHFVVRTEALDRCADYVIDTIRERYPDLAVPFHSRWRHFTAGGVDRWAVLTAGLAEAPLERARIGVDLVVTSVLLDAGAGPDWRYREPATGACYTRSEGLAVASVQMFRDGLFSADPGVPLRADAAALEWLTAEDLGRAMQVGPDNPLAGLTGRAELLARLAAAMRADSQRFGQAPRIGHLVDHVLALADTNGALPAAELLGVLLDALGGIWPERPRLAGVELGDVWQHSALVADDATSGWVPFHKLSQWLAYSLVEPLADAGVTITELDGLTGLPEYRNGGLFIDLGVLAVRDPARLLEPQPVDDEFVVEWRALTVALLDRLAERIRERLGADAADWPLIRVLEGGSWHAGRRIARERRGPTGPPPVTIVSDGTVF
ncbi:DUF1688 family protein [Salinisphaera sp. SPP-AMP-43]|uniref:DUF1688 family protein n=1 Tax=Salinisphaera sp. SPP-AMP-43 TaxID=3121288 RepID=UPI003C6E0A15